MTFHHWFEQKGWRAALGFKKLLSLSTFMLFCYIVAWFDQTQVLTKFTWWCHVFLGHHRLLLPFICAPYIFLTHLFSPINSTCLKHQRVPLLILNFLPPMHPLTQKYSLCYKPGHFAPNEVSTDSLVEFQSSER